MWLQRDMVERIVKHCNSSSELRPFGLLYLLTYAFLLRLPSEALPTRLGIAGLHVDGETMVLTLARRQVSLTSCMFVGQLLQCQAKQTTWQQTCSWVLVQGVGGM